VRSLLLLCVLFVANAWGEERYQVILMTVAAADDEAARARLASWAEELNEAADEYPTARAYFGCIDTRDGERWLLFGWRDPIAGLIRADFPQTLRTIRRLPVAGEHPFADAAWLPVADVRAAIGEHR